MLQENKNLVCVQCGISYLPKYKYGKSYLSKRKFCSRTCYASGSSNDVTKFQKGHKPLVDNSKEKNGQWKGGVTPVNHLIRTSQRYKLWRKAVFERDGYTCVSCKLKGHKGLGRRVTLNADHIKSFAEFPELRFEISNGRTLCLQCHTKTENFGKNIRFKKI